MEGDPMTAVRQQQKAATRKAILDAAIHVFARLGFDGTNFREITALCGAQRPLILYHFQSKEALWRLAAEEVERRFNDVFDGGYAPENEPDDHAKVRHAMSCFLDALCEVPEYGQIYLREGAAEGPRMEWLAHHFVPRRALSLQLTDRSLQERMQKTVLRDILAGTLVAFVALGPLLDRSLAVATKQKSAGVYPLTPKKRDELVEYMLKLVF